MELTLIEMIICKRSPQVVRSPHRPGDSLT
jgi:hypothetical protein